MTRMGCVSSATYKKKEKTRGIRAWDSVPGLLKSLVFPFCVSAVRGKTKKSTLMTWFTLFKASDSCCYGLLNLSSFWTDLNYRHLYAPALKLNTEY